MKSRPKYITALSIDSDDKKVTFDAELGTEKQVNLNILADNDHEPIDLMKGFSDAWQPIDDSCTTDQIIEANNLRKIMSTPYCLRDSWKIGLRKNNLSIIMDIQQIDDFQLPPDVNYRGQYFEHIVTGNTASQTKEKLSQPLPTQRDTFCGVFDAEVQNFKLLIGAEIDAYNQTPDNHVEIKLANDFSQRRFFSWWVQSYLSGTMEILVGLRTSDKLTSLHKFKMEELPRIRGRTYQNIPIKPNLRWWPDRCTTFLENVLAWLYEHFGDCKKNTAETGHIEYKSEEGVIELHMGEGNVVKRNVRDFELSSVKRGSNLGKFE